MREIIYKNKIIRFNGYEVKGDQVVFYFGSYSFSIPKKDFERLEIREV